MHPRVCPLKSTSDELQVLGLPEAVEIGPENDRASGGALIRI